MSSPHLSQSIALAWAAMARSEGGNAPSGHSLPLRSGAISSPRQIVRRSDAVCVFRRSVRSGAVLLHSVVPVACGPPPVI